MAVLHTQKNRITQELNADVSRRRKSVLLIGIPAALLCTVAIEGGFLAWIVLAIVWFIAGNRVRPRLGGRRGKITPSTF